MSRNLRTHNLRPAAHRAVRSVLAGLAMTTIIGVAGVRSASAMESTSGDSRTLTLSPTARFSTDPPEVVSYGPLTLLVSIRELVSGVTVRFTADGKTSPVVRRSS